MPDTDPLNTNPLNTGGATTSQGPAAGLVAVVTVRPGVPDPARTVVVARPGPTG